jgi:YhgE/Pip-like protein
MVVNTTENSAAAEENILRSPKFWFAPVILVGIVMGLLAWLYMGWILNPQDNIRDFPIAVVNEDVGATVPAAPGSPSPSGEKENLGNTISTGLLDNVPKTQVDLQQMDWAKAQSEMSKGAIYGAIVIPSNFSTATGELAIAAAKGTTITKPVITVYTNPRAGAIPVSLVQAITEPALAAVNTKVSAQLTAATNEELKTLGAPALSGPGTFVLSEPINVSTVEYHPLPSGTGFGLSAFYYTLLLILAGFTGATIVNSTVDGLLGYTPSEVGPKVVSRARTNLSRFQTLLVKWGCVVLMGIAMSGLYIGVCTLLGMSLPHMLLLWLFGALAISAIGITAMSVMAAFGNIGLLINLIVFVILDLPSSGGTFPLQAEPRVYSVLSIFEPMRQVFLGISSIIYFDAQWDAGLSRALMMTVIGLLIGVLLGLIVTRYYDRKGLNRSAETA